MRARVGARNIYTARAPETEPHPQMKVFKNLQKLMKKLFLKKFSNVQGIFSNVSREH